uniref:Uncharacterized protein n=1 Tax=Arundo donax TaxID=35708 RepID=A0A0A9C3W5_ARUDO
MEIKSLSHGSGRWIGNFHALLSMDSSLEVFQSFKSFFTDSSHVKFGLPLPLFTLSTRLNIDSFLVRRP